MNHFPFQTLISNGQLDNALPRASFRSALVLLAPGNWVTARLVGIQPLCDRRRVGFAHPPGMVLPRGAAGCLSLLNSQGLRKTRSAVTKSRTQAFILQSHKTFGLLTIAQAEQKADTFVLGLSWKESLFSPN